jgi:hypothetical protein
MYEGKIQCLIIKQPAGRYRDISRDHGVGSSNDQTFKLLSNFKLFKFSERRAESLIIFHYAECQ